MRPSPKGFGCLNLRRQNLTGYAQTYLHSVGGGFVWLVHIACMRLARAAPRPSRVESLPCDRIGCLLWPENVEDPRLEP